MGSSEAREPDAGLIRAVGVAGLTASIVNVTVGGGIFRLPAAVAASLGAGAPVAYLVCAVAMGLIALCFAQTGRRVSATGGPYAYVEVAFGPFLGFLAGVLTWIVGTLAVAAVSTIFVDSIGALVPALDGPAMHAVVLAAILGLLSAVNIFGVRHGTRLNTVATIAKVLPLALLVFGGLAFVRPANLGWTAAPAAGAVARTSILLIFAFSGVESALMPSGEIKDVGRTVPRAIFAGMTIVTLLYLSLQLVAQGVLGDQLATQQAPLAEAAAIVFGPWGRSCLLLGAMVSMFGYISGMTLAVPRALFAFGCDGFLPRIVASVHTRFHTPHVAIVIQGIIVGVLAVSNGFERLAILANLATLILYAMCCLAAWEVARRDAPAGGSPLWAQGVGPLAAASCVVILFMLTSITRAEWLVAIGAIATASGLFWLTRTLRTRQPAR